MRVNFYPVQWRFKLKKPKRYILIPVNQDSILDSDRCDLQTIALRLKKKINDSGKYNAKILWLDDKNVTNMIASLKSEQGDKLYVSAHGSHFAIGTKGDGVCIGPEELATILVKIQLPHNFEHVKIFACHSAEFYDVENQEYRAPSGSIEFQQTFAAKVMTKLHEMDFSNVVVTGYMGAIHYIENRGKYEGPYLGWEPKDEMFTRLFTDMDQLWVTPSKGSLRFSSSKIKDEQESYADPHNLESLNMRKLQY
jgi:hypothetical protein